jgi:hypothetical protein
MTRLARGLLFYLCAAGMVSGADPKAIPDNTPVALDPIAQLDLRTATMMDFGAATPHNGFRWLSVTHDSAENSQPGLTLFQIPVYQAVVRFGGEKITEIVISFYNRGDGGDMSKENFDILNQKCAQALTAFTKVQAVDRGKDPTNAVKAEGLAWQTDKAQFLLESSISKTPETGFRPEFVRLTITPPEKPKSLLEESLASDLPAAVFSGTDHVKSLPNGDVLIQGIPMVDQGQKGYCVVASAERVMRYYGVKVDENELAEIADSSAQKGTSPAAMIDSLKKLANRLRVKTRVQEEFNDERLNAMLDEYDKYAMREQHAPPLNRYVDDFSKLIQQINPDILVEARTKNPSEMDRFFRTVQAHVDQGVPPLWSVMIGLFPHGKTPREFGGHMRLIIGYNLKTNEVLFSDSWGYGHELSRMPLVAAWTMTVGLCSIEPLE